MDPGVIGPDLDQVLERALFAGLRTVDDDESFIYRGVKALVAQTDAGPFLAARPVAGPRRRFERARALHMLLVQARPALVTAGFAAVQQASRAFAAELLAPAAWLASRVDGGGVDEDRVRELAAELGVSEMVVQHQLANHRLADVVEG